MKRIVLSLEQNIGDEDKFRVSGRGEFQSQGPMTMTNEKDHSPGDDRTYGIERTNESEDLVETECYENERLLQHWVFFQSHGTHSELLVERSQG